tara:strand:+ start:2223 stop:2420 length:198 start_codon:yes stop_codon:yes gene_type:complete
MIQALYSYVRDEKSNAILNTDVAALNKYKLERALHRKVEKLTDELVDVKKCLTQISARLDKIETE